MNATPKFKSTMCPPPGGMFYFEVGGERVEAPDWITMRRLVIPVLARHGVRLTPEEAVAAYMCPDMPKWYCTSGGVDTVLSAEARTKAKPYFSMHVVPVPEIMRRLAVCRACPRHSRNVCMTCTGHAKWILAGFGNRRPALPDDSMSGTCMAARTFEMAVASVDGPLPEWGDVPETCWRNVK